MVPCSRRAFSVAALAVVFGFGASAQSVISTHSGVLHTSEGAVFADDQPVNQKYGTFPDLKEKSVLRTESGRAEILLTPGVFLRIGENSAVKMIDNRLADTRVELLKGSAVVECDDPMKENAVTMIYGDFQIHVHKSSVFEMLANPAEIKVFHGEAEVESGGNFSVVHSGKMMPFNQALAQERFDAKNEGDELTRWSEERSQAISVANLSAAKSVRDSGGFLNTGLFSNGMMPYGTWYYNPFYSMYTYIPMNGMLWSPYGFGFFSPYTVYQVYNNPYYYYGGGGGSGSTTTTGTRTSSGNRLGYGTVGAPRPNSGLTYSRSTSNVASSTFSPALPSIGSGISSMGSGLSGPSGISGGSSSGGRSTGHGK